MTQITKTVNLTLGNPTIQKYIDQYPDISWMDKEILSDYQNNKFCFVGIKISVFVYADIGNLHDEIISSLWGIEDYGNTDSDNYHDNVIIPDLKSEIRNSLKVVYNFSDQEIDRALNNATKYPGDISW